MAIEPINKPEAKAAAEATQRGSELHPDEKREGQLNEQEKLEQERDLDNSPVTGLKKKALDALQALERELPEDQRSQYKQDLQKFEKYIDGFSVKEGEDKQKYEELAQVHGEKVRDQIYAEYREEFRNILTTIPKLTDNMEDKTAEEKRATVAVVRTLVNSIVAGEIQGDLVSDYPIGTNADRETMERIDSITEIAMRRRVPFHEYTQQYLEAGADPREIIRQEASERVERFNDLIRAVEPLLPEQTPSGIKHEVRKRVPGGAWETESNRNLLKSALEGTIKKSDLVRDVTPLEALGGAFGAKYKAESYIVTAKEHGAIINDKNIKKGFNVEVSEGTLYEFKFRHELWGEPLEEGQTHWDKSAYDIISVPRFTYRLDTLTKAEQEVERLGIYEHDEKKGIYYTLTTDNEGELKVLPLTDKEYSKMLANAQKTVESFRSQFEKIKVDPKRFEDKRKECFVQELAANPESWIDYELAYVGIEKSLKNSGDFASYEVEAQMPDITEGVRKQFLEFQKAYGRRSQYELIARTRLDVQPGTPQYTQLLERKTREIEYEFALKAMVLNEVSEELQNKIAAYRSVRLDGNLNPEEKAKSRYILRSELNALTLNLDYQIEVRVLSRLEASSKGTDLEQASTEVTEAFTPFMRREGVTLNLQTLGASALNLESKLSGHVVPRFDYANEFMSPDQLVTYTAVIENEKAASKARDWVERVKTHQEPLPPGMTADILENELEQNERKANDEIDRYEGKLLNIYGTIAQWGTQAILPEYTVEDNTKIISERDKQQQRFNLVTEKYGRTITDAEKSHQRMLLAVQNTSEAEKKIDKLTNFLDSYERSVQELYERLRAKDETVSALPIIRTVIEAKIP